MTRLAAILLLTLILTLPAPAALPPDKAAALDGSYAAINQKTVTVMQRWPSSPKTASDIQYYTNAINAARARWANTPYKKIFDQAYQAEMARPASPPSKTPQQGTVSTVPRPQPIPPEPPFHLSTTAKVVLFFAALWGCRKLWKIRPGTVSAIDHNQYSPVELSAEDQQQIAAAQQRRDQRLAQIQGKAQSLERQIRECQAQLAALAARAASRADELLASAASALNQATPEFERYRASLEQRFPVAMAPWTSDIWTDFARQPKPEPPQRISVARVQEAGFAGERGIEWVKMVPLLEAKGPIVVRCDPASKDRARAVIQNMVLRAALAAPAEVCFSLIDPFGMGAGFPMKKLLPRVRRSEFAPADELAGIMEDIRRINDAVVGQADSFAGLTREQRAGEQFEIVAVLDYPGEYQRDPRAQEYLARIGQAGPRAGRHLILEWNDVPGTPEPRFQNQVTIDVAGAPAGWQFDPVAPPDLRQTLLTAVNKIKSESTGGDWDSLVRPARFFSESSERMVSTPVGERLNIWFGENQDRKPCSHGMLAGQSGSGKSSLLHVLITGLAARYSPDELQLMLVDGKEGVELEYYRGLPHAQVVCLRTPAAVARAVLEDLRAEMKDRFAKFKAVQAQKLEDYRRITGAKMPRMLMVVDEFQQLLAGDSDRGSESLTEVLEKGRAAGIHLLLTSQMFEVRGLQASTMAHVHLRAALMLASDYVQGVTAFNAEGKKLIKALSQGQVVINDESGRDGANNRGAVARLDKPPGASLKEIIAEITAAAGGPGKAVVLSGQDNAVLAENPFIGQWKSAPPDAASLQMVAQKKVRDGGFEITEWSQAERPLPLWLGRKFDVRGHVAVVLRRGQGQNLLALGSSGSIRLCMLANALAGLRAMRSLVDGEILFLDGLPAGHAGEGMLAAGLEILRGAGASVERATPETAAAALDAFAPVALQPRNPESVRLLILSEPEQFPMLAAPQGYGVLPTGVAKVFRDLLRNGPGAGVHSIVTGLGMRAFASLLPERDKALFNHRVVQQTSDEESVALFDRPIAGQIKSLTDHHMGAMYVDIVKGVREAQLFKSYAATAATGGEQTAADLAAALRTLYGTDRFGAAGS